MKKTITLTCFLATLLANAQNDCSTAVTITPGLYTTGTIDGTNFNEGCWSNTSLEGEHAEWYVYTPAANGIASLITNLPANDGITLSNHIQVSVYDGDCNNLACKAAYGPISSPPPYRPDFSFEVRTGKTYYIAFDNFGSDKGVQFQFTVQTPDCSSSLPFTETWLTHLGFTCWETFNTDDQQKWVYYNVANFNEDPANDPVAAAFPSINTAQPKNDWLVSPAVALQSGTTYTISVKYNALDSGIGVANETLRTFILDNPSPSVPQLSQLGEVTGITMQGGHVEPFNMDLATTVSYAYTPDDSGDYYIGLHAASPGGTGVLIIYEVKVTEGALNSAGFDFDAVKVYPNPANDKIFIEAGNDDMIHLISFTDMNGRKIFEKRVDAVNGEIDLAQMAEGIYVVQLISDKAITTKKIIKR